jgi:hypothetical protein
LELAQFLQNKSIRTLSIGYLNQLQDILAEDAIITPEKFSILRKRILDTMNDSIRANNELFEQFKN